MSGPSGSLARMQALVRRVRLVPFALVSLPEGVIEAASQELNRLIDATDDVTGRPLSAITRGLWRSEPMRLLRAGAQSSFSSSISVRCGDSQLVPCTAAARIVEASDDRWLLVAFDTAGRGMPLLHDATSAASVVFGIGDGAGGISDVTESVQDVLGYTADEFTSIELSEMVHRDDHEAFVALASTAQASRRPCAMTIRLHAANGDAIALRLVLSTLHFEDDRGFAFVLVADDDREEAVAPAPAERMGEIEVRLRRIALELAAIGVTESAAPTTAPDVLATIAHLSPKRQEILHRLRDGARVPGIARAMYLSESTVRNHLSAIFREFGVTSQAELLEVLSNRR